MINFPKLVDYVEWIWITTNCFGWKTLFFEFMIEKNSNQLNETAFMNRKRISSL